MYTIKKVLNNNILLVVNDKEVQTIFIGKAIGYGATIGTPFKDLSKVKQIFVFKDPSNLKVFDEMIRDDTDEIVLSIVEDAIAELENEYQDINEKIHITLLDHVNFAIKRAKENILFDNPFNDDVRILYEKEYDYALKLVGKINEAKNIELPESEVGIIAIHINSAVNKEKIETSRFRQTLINAIASSIYSEFNISPKPDSLAHRRMLIHVKFAVDRIIENKNIDNEMEDYIKEHFSDIYQRINKEMEKIAEDYEVNIPDSETCYLAVHFGRIIKEK